MNISIPNFERNLYEWKMLQNAKAHCWFYKKLKTYRLFSANQFSQKFGPIENGAASTVGIARKFLISFFYVEL